MKDKMECENCAIGRADLLGCKIKSKCHNFAKWERPTYLWLDILPTEPGWYWLREQVPNGTDIWSFNVVKVENNNGKLSIWCEMNGWETVKSIAGQFQGPLTPNDGEG